MFYKSINIRNKSIFSSTSKIEKHVLTPIFSVYTTLSMNIMAKCTFPYKRNDLRYISAHIPRYLRLFHFFHMYQRSYYPGSWGKFDRIKIRFEKENKIKCVFWEPYLLQNISKVFIDVLVHRENSEMQKFVVRNIFFSEIKYCIHK